MVIQINILLLNNGKHGKSHYVNNELVDLKNNEELNIYDLFIN